MTDAHAPTDYVSYLEKKVAFLEQLIEDVMQQYNPGGTLPCYPRWKSDSNTGIDPFSSY